MLGSDWPRRGDVIIAMSTRFRWTRRFPISYGRWHQCCREVETSEKHIFEKSKEIRIVHHPSCTGSKVKQLPKPNIYVSSLCLQVESDALLMFVSSLF